MASWKENRVVGIVAGVAIAITLTVITVCMAREAAKFKRSPSTQPVMPAVPDDAERRRGT